MSVPNMNRARRSFNGLCALALLGMMASLIWNPASCCTPFDTSSQVRLGMEDCCAGPDMPCPARLQSCSGGSAGAILPARPAATWSVLLLAQAPRLGRPAISPSPEPLVFSFGSSPLDRLNAPLLI
jgi:hypothetical protein